MKYQELFDSNKIRICPISAMWLLLTLLVSIFILTSCSTPSSISRSYTKPIEKLVDNKLVNKNETDNQSNDQDEFSKLMNEAKKKDSKSKKNKNNDNTTSAKSISSLPKFDEMVMKLDKDVSEIKSDVIALKNDNVEIKSSLEEIKDVLRSINDKRAKVSVVGDINETEKYKQPKSESPIIASNTPSENKNLNNFISNAQISKPKKVILSNEKINERNIERKTEKNQVKNVVPKESKITKEIKSIPETKNTINNNIQPKVSSTDNTPKEATKDAPKDDKLSIAMDNIKSKKYKEAINDLIDLLNTTNNANLKGETQYYLGESHLNLRNYDKAIDYFKSVLKSPKTDYYDDSSFKIADSYYKKGDKSNAKNEFQNFVKNYPSSNYLPFARKMIQQL